MKHSMIKCTLATALTIGLAACGGGGSGGNNSGGGSGNVKKFDGNWKSSSCETIGTRSYKQAWNINGNNLNNDIKVWLTSNNCSGTPKDVNVTATLEYKNEIDDTGTCSAGKAQEVDVTYTSIKYGSTTITGEQNIENILASQNIDKALPKYGLLCKGDDGKLYRGLITDDKDASTATKRPTEVDVTNPLIP